MKSILIGLFCSTEALRLSKELNQLSVQAHHNFDTDTIVSENKNIKNLVKFKDGVELMDKYDSNKDGEVTEVEMDHFFEKVISDKVGGFRAKAQQIYNHQVHTVIP